MPVTYSLVMIVTADKKDDANVLGEGLGHGPSTFSNPLYTGETLSHYGSHAWASQGFIDLLTAAGEGTLPQPSDGRTWDEWGLSDAGVWAIFTALTPSYKSIAEQPARVHYDSVLTAMELSEPIVGDI